MTNVFISYSRKDKEFVQVLHQALEKSTYDAWIDWQDIPPTADWWAEIEAGIEAADAFIFVISPDSVASKVCAQEVDYATSHNKRLVPIVHREGVDRAQLHPALSKHNWLYFRATDSFDLAFAELVDALNLDLEHVKVHTKLLVQTQEWLHKSRDPDFLLRGSQLESTLIWITEGADKEPRLTLSQREYIAASSKAERDRQEAEIQRQQEELRRQRRWLGLVGAAFVVASSLGVVAFSQFRMAKAQRQEVERREIETLATSAEALLNSNQGLEGLVYGLQAARKLEQSQAVPLATQYRVTAALQQALRKTPERNRLIGHSDQIWYSALSPDGQFIVSAGRDHAAKLWALDGREIAAFEGHSEPVSWVAASPDNQLIATTSEDRTVKLWEPTGKLIKTLTEHTGSVRSVSFAPDGQQFVSASTDGTVKFWDFEGHVLKTIQAPGAVCHASFSPDGELVLAFSCGTEAQLWTASTGHVMTTFAGHTSTIRRGVFSPDGQLLATASNDGVIKLWNRQGEELVSIEAHTQAIWGLRFSADGQTLYSAGEDGSFKIWNLEGELLEAIDDLTPAIDSIDVSADGNTLVLGDRGGAVRIWQLKQQAFSQNDGIRNVSFSPDGQTLMTASGGNGQTIKLWTLEGTLLKVLQDFNDPVTWASFTPEGTAINVGDESGTARTLALDGQEISDWEQGLKDGTAVSFSPDGKIVARANIDGAIELQSHQGQRLASFQADDQPVEAITFSPDSRKLASLSADGTVNIWSIEGELLTALNGHKSTVAEIAFSPSGERLASAGYDRTVKLWSSSGEELATLRGHRASVLAVAFSADGQLLASAGSDETIRLWAADGEALVTLQGHTSPIRSLSFSPDGRTLASADEAGQTLLWNLRFEDLLVQTCHELRDYLTTSANLSASDRALCDGVERDWLAEGEALARQGDLEAAADKFEHALKQYPHWTFDPLLKAKQIAAAIPLNQAEQYVASQNLSAATAAYEQALAIYPELDFVPAQRAHQEIEQTLIRQLEALTSASLMDDDQIEAAIAIFQESRQLAGKVDTSAQTLNNLCWNGALQGYAESVLEICEAAVALDSDHGGIIDSRGVARALTGDIPGAIADFQYFIDWNPGQDWVIAEEERTQRQQWIRHLQVGEDPFTPEVLENLQ